MSAITIEDDLVHYEVLGRGRPVILLHSWLGSWRYWVPAMQQLSMKYRTYALDLWGFGDSGRDTKRYDFRSQVKLLDQFMEKLGITKAALIGHGLGASVMVRYALEYPDRVPRLMAVSPPLFRMAPSSNPLTFNVPKPQLPAPAASCTRAAPAAPSRLRLCLRRRFRRCPPTRTNPAKNHPTTKPTRLIPRRKPCPGGPKK